MIITTTYIASTKDIIFNNTNYIKTGKIGYKILKSEPSRWNSDLFFLTIELDEEK